MPREAERGSLPWEPVNYWRCFHPETGELWIEDRNELAVRTAAAKIGAPVEQLWRTVPREEWRTETASVPWGAFPQECPECHRVLTLSEAGDHKMDCSRRGQQARPVVILRDTDGEPVSIDPDNDPATLAEALSLLHRVHNFASLPDETEDYGSERLAGFARGDATCRAALREILLTAGDALRDMIESDDPVTRIRMRRSDEDTSGW